MSQAQSLLNNLTATASLSDANVATSPIHDYLLVDAEGRFINVPATEILFGVETDLDSDRKHFQCPRYVGDNIDLTTLGIRIAYRNAKGEEDAYIVEDVTVRGEWITFTWLLGGKLFASKGTVHFAICAVNVDEDGYETCVWNTTLASGNVLEGLHVDLTISEYSEASDLLQQLLNLLSTRTEEAVQSVTDEGAKQIEDIKDAGEEQQTLIESKGAEILATIPDDYTSTHNAADDAVRKKACAIVMEEEGEVISVNDASDDYVRGLKVFGKSEQVETPNPDYPQEIVSVGDDGGIDVIVGSRNLFNKNSTNESNSMILFPGTYYCRRFFGDSTETNARLHIKIDDSWKIIESVGNYDNSNIMVEGSAFSWYENKQKLTLKKSYEIFYGLPKGEKLTIAIDEYLESYEDDNNSVITIPRALPGIPVSSDGNYTDSNGQQWICDEVDFERGVYIQRVITKTFSGSDSESWYTYAVKDGADYTAYQESLLCNDVQIFSGTYNETSCVLSDKFEAVPLSKIYSNGMQGVGISNASPVIRICVDACKGYSLGEFVAWLNENPFTLIYPLATPIETPLTADELNTFRVIHTNYPNTVVMNDSGATMRLLYNADTKTFILQNGGGGTTAAKISLTLSANKWVVSDNGLYYTQNTGVVVDDNVKVDLQPTADQMVALISDGISMFVSNENGYIVAYAVGAKPSSDMVIQATKMAVIYV